MIRRWLIRSLFMLTVLQCMAGWLWSTNHCFLIYRRHGNILIIFGMQWGRIFLIHGQDPMPGPVGWHWGVEQLGRHWDFDSIVGYYNFLGFSFGWLSDYVGIDVPYWFLILVFAGVLWFVWRKSRGRPETQRGFPVEPAAAKDQGAAESPRGA